MALSSSWFKNDPVFAKAAENLPPMKKGDVGESVRYLQLALIELGFSMPISTAKYGSPDGDYGAETKAQVEEFQKKNGLASEADGRVGKNTMAKLDGRMVALDRPRPILPPLGGGSVPGPVVITQLAKDVVAILREPAVLSINFRYEYVWFAGSFLSKVAEAIEAGRIRVAFDPDLEGVAEYVPFNDVVQKNQLNLSFDDPRSSPYKRSVVVHECVHAYQDMLGLAMDKYSSEGLAFAVQVWFYEAVAHTPATPPQIGTLTKVGGVWQAALGELRNARAAKLPVIALHGHAITAALKLVPAYAAMRQYIPYDGVP